MTATNYKVQRLASHLTHTTPREWETRFVGTAAEAIAFWQSAPSASGDEHRIVDAEGAEQAILGPTECAPIY